MSEASQVFGIWCHEQSKLRIEATRRSTLPGEVHTDMHDWYNIIRVVWQTINIPWASTQDGVLVLVVSSLHLIVGSSFSWQAFFFFIPQFVMLLDTLSSQARLAFDALPEGAQNNVGLVTGVIALFSVWLLWRLWRFTIIPWMYPDDPEELPYWIPSKYFDTVIFFLSCTS